MTASKSIGEQLKMAKCHYCHVGSALGVGGCTALMDLITISEIFTFAFLDKLFSPNVCNGIEKFIGAWDIHVTVRLKLLFHILSVFFSNSHICSQMQTIF